PGLGRVLPGGGALCHRRWRAGPALCPRPRRIPGSQGALHPDERRAAGLPRRSFRRGQRQHPDPRNLEEGGAQHLPRMPSCAARRRRDAPWRDPALQGPAALRCLHARLGYAQQQRAVLARQSPDRSLCRLQRGRVRQGEGIRDPRAQRVRIKAEPALYPRVPGWRFRRRRSVVCLWSLEMTAQNQYSLPKKAKGARPYFFEDPAVDKLVAMLMGLTGEVSVLADRVDTLERLLAAQGTLPAGSVDSYAPDAAVREARDARREQMLRNVLRIIAQDQEDPDAGKPNDAAYYQAVEQVEQ